LTAEQLEASRAERMRQNGNGALTLEDARTWIEETGLCLFLPRRQFSSSIAPSFVEAVAGNQNATPDPKHIQLAEELLVRLELDDVAVRLNLLGQPGEQPDFVVASWVLPYVYALRGDRDWRRSPQLTGSRQVSQLAVQAYKLLEAGEITIPELKHALGREVTEVAVLRAITELWQQLRIIPVIAAPGAPAKWQLLRLRYQKAIAEGASTSQVTAISVLASIYLQAVIAASMEEVELFLAPLTARSKVREVLRGLVATRQVHTISMGHAPHFYVAGTLPEFALPQGLYSSSSMPASAYFMRSHDHDDDLAEVEPAKALFSAPAKPVFVAPSKPIEARPIEVRQPVEAHTPRIPALRPAAARKPASNGKAIASRPHFSRPATHSRDRKPAQSSAASRPARRTGAEVRPASARPTSARPVSSRPASTRPSNARPAAGSRSSATTRWNPKAANGVKPKQNSANGAKGPISKHAGNGSSNGVRSNGTRNGSVARPSNGKPVARTAKSSAPAWGARNGHSSNGHSSNGHSNGNGHKTNGHSNGAKPVGKASAGSARGSSLSRNGSSSRKDVRTDARPSRTSRKPALAAGAKAGNSKRYGLTARPKQETKKRG
jgi:23S rRNA pseudouridine2605 synthase